MTLGVARAGDYTNYPEPCSFKGHVTYGDIAGKCSTLQLNLPGYHVRWALTLKFTKDTEAVARQLLPDQFADMVRAQSLSDGSDVIVLPLWGDLKVQETDPDYRAMIAAAAPIYETRPNMITVSIVEDSPRTIQILFEEPESFLDLTTRQPSAGWWTLFQQAYYRLATNRNNGFSIPDTSGSARPKQ
ncbi:MAG TPA: hypothetical protein VKS01_00955 [Bryobacteraceae bacterium]|nr:hypothetical protein [Bryobacteraceae bacterium]